MKRELISEATRPEIFDGVKADQPKQLGDVLKTILEGIATAHKDVPEISAMQAAKEGLTEAVKAYAPGLSLSKILSDVGAELKEKCEQGAHEAAAGLFTGSSFVMYQRNGEQVEDPQHGIEEQARQEQHRSGREI